MQKEGLEAQTLNGIPASFVNEKYGQHVRNTFDIWMAKSNRPTPLIVFIHGGGFVGGDKSKYFDSPDWDHFLEAGISVATINYRFMNEAPYGILTSMKDSKRCLQYLRYHSGKYNIDKNRIACSGGSAGAGTALWLAFNEDMADYANNDPVLRESTRIVCAGAFATQSTYDILKWDDILGIPVSSSEEEKFEIGRAFGFKTVENVDLHKQIQVRNDLDFLNHMNNNSSPFFVFNKQPGGIPVSQDELNHHPLHAKALKEKAEIEGVEAIVYAPEIGINDQSGKDLVAFFLEKLLK